MEVRLSSFFQQIPSWESMRTNVKVKASAIVAAISAIAVAIFAALCHFLKKKKEEEGRPLVATESLASHLTPKAGQEVQARELPVSEEKPKASANVSPVSANARALEHMKRAKISSKRGKPTVKFQGLNN